MLGREDGAQAYAGRLGQQVDIAPPLRVYPGLIRDEPHRASGQRGEALRDQLVESRARPVRTWGRGIRRGRRGRELFRHRGLRRGRLVHAEEGSSHHPAHPATQVGHIALAIRMDAVREDDRVHPAGGVHPDGGAGETGMPDRAHREEGAQRARVGGGHVPAEPARGLADLMRRKRGTDGGLLQIALAVQLPAPQEHPAEARDVIGGGKKSCMPRHAAQEPRIAVVHHAAEHARAEHLGRREARLPLGGWPEGAVLHPERAVEALAHELVERLAAQPGL